MYSIVNREKISRQFEGCEWAWVGAGQSRGASEGSRALGVVL